MLPTRSQINVLRCNLMQISPVRSIQYITNLSHLFSSARRRVQPVGKVATEESDCSKAVESEIRNLKAKMFEVCRKIHSAFCRSPPSVKARRVETNCSAETVIGNDFRLEVLETIRCIRKLPDESLLQTSQKEAITRGVAEEKKKGNAAHRVRDCIISFEHRSRRSNRQKRQRNASLTRVETYKSTQTLNA